jgi:hypothetical protein
VLCTDADAARTRAASAAERAVEESRAARALEDRVLEIAATAGRDARQARRARVPDFYEHGAGAWGAVHGVLVAADEAAKQAAVVDEAVRSARTVNDSYGLSNLHRHVGVANAAATDAKRRAKETEDRVVEFREANRRADEYRDGEQKAAERAVKAADEVIAASGLASAAARSAAVHAADALQRATDAKTAAVQGKVEEGQKEANNAKEAANKAEEQLKNAEKARDRARGLVLTLVKGHSR